MKKSIFKTLLYQGFILNFKLQFLALELYFLPFKLIFLAPDFFPGKI